MNVFTDYVGHSDLYHCLHLLFEKRLGAQLFCPEGIEWHKKGFVKFSAPITVGKIETIEDVIKYPGTECEKLIVVDGVYRYHRKMELDKGRYVQKAITFEQFLKMDFDIIVATCYQHEKTFHDLVHKHKPNAVFIRLINNIHEMPLGFCKNILLATLTPMPSNVNYINFHPEFYEGYHYTLPTNHKTINNFFGDLPSYPVDLDSWNQCTSLLPDFTFQMHASPKFVPHLLMPQAMKDSAFIWHVKGPGGAGFIGYQALACGRPCIIKKKYSVIHNTPIQFLFADGINCIDLDLGVKRGVEMIRELAQPDRHIEVCKVTAEKFKKDVNFSEEAERIKEWINLLRR